LPRAPPPPPPDARSSPDAWAPSPHPWPLPTLALSLTRSSPSCAASPARPLTSHGKPWWLGFERHLSPTRAPPISAPSVSRSLIRLPRRALPWGLGFERHRSLFLTSPSHQLRPSSRRRRYILGQLTRVWYASHMLDASSSILFLLLDRSVIYAWMNGGGSCNY